MRIIMSAAEKLEFGRWVRDKRKSLGMKQRVLSELCQIPQANISFLEKGQRGIGYARLPYLAAALEVPVEEVQARMGIFPEWLTLSLMDTRSWRLVSRLRELGDPEILYLERVVGDLLGGGDGVDVSDSMLSESMEVELES